MLEFNKEVNGAIVDPAFIRKTRKKLKLDQQEAAEIFGGGPNAFSRYENGKTRPSQALVQLLKILDKHPDLINEVKPTQSTQVAAASRMKSNLSTRRTKLPSGT
jgi:HTH-type transcriptional regulator/antitoxin MqsA